MNSPALRATVTRPFCRNLSSETLVGSDTGRQKFSTRVLDKSFRRKSGDGKHLPALRILGLALLVLVALAAQLQNASAADTQPTTIITPTSKPEFAAASDLATLQCGNLIYAGNQSSVCFADRFLADVAAQTNLRVNQKFCPVRLDAEAVFDFPFCVMSGNENFSLSDKERKQLRKYLTQGGFLLVSPGCSDEQWDRAFRKEVKLCFPDLALKAIPASHPIFALVHQVPQLTDKHGKAAVLEGLEIQGRLGLVYSKEGLNDVQNAKGCCCCGGNELRDPARINVNVFTYAVLY